VAPDLTGAGRLPQERTLGLIQEWTEVLSGDRVENYYR